MSGPGATPAPGEPPAVALFLSSARGRWVLAATVLGSGIASLDATVVGIALPSISRSFGGGVGTLQWVVTGYSLTLAAFLLLGGSLGDRFGRRRIFSIGIAWFAVASAACGFAPNAGLLVRRPRRPGRRRRPADAGQPGHPPGVVPRRGPLPGHRRLVGLRRRGHGRRAAGRRLPAGRRLVALGLLHQPPGRRRRPRAHGPPRARDRATRPPRTTSTCPGAALAVVFLAGLTYAFIEGPVARVGRSRSSSPPSWSPSLAAPAFLLVEGRSADPMLPLDLFRVRQFSGANAVTFVVYGALGGALFLLPVELQVVAGYSPLDSGLALLPVTVIMLSSPPAPDSSRPASDPGSR